MIALIVIRKNFLSANYSTSNKLTTSVAEYVKHFTELVDQLKAYSQTTDPMFYSMRFIDGLRPEIKAIVLVLRPHNLDTTCTVALL
jgi:hypothetical protein